MLRVCDKFYKTNSKPNKTDVCLAQILRNLALWDLALFIKKKHILYTR